MSNAAPQANRALFDAATVENSSIGGTAINGRGLVVSR